MKTAMQELIELIVNNRTRLDIIEKNQQMWLEKEKEQIQKAFLNGQEIPINHPTLPHYSKEEYYNDNYNQNK